MLMRKLVLGLGTGRCGTWTLTKIFKNQKDFSATHEGYFLPWRHDSQRAYGVLVKIYQDKASYLSDTGFYWISYVEDVLSVIPDAAFVCLKRDMDLVVESFDNRTPFNNYWTDTGSVHWSWDAWKLSHLNAMFPSYDLPKRHAIAAYWEEYYRKAHSFEKRFPTNFKVFNIKDLNSTKGIGQILDFIGIPEHKMVLDIVNAENVGKNTVLDVVDLIKYDNNGEKVGLCGQCMKNPPDKIIKNKTHSLIMYVCNICVDEAEKRLRNMGLVNA